MVASAPGLKPCFLLDFGFMKINCFSVAESGGPIFYYGLWLIFFWFEAESACLGAAGYPGVSADPWFASVSRLAWGGLLLPSADVEGFLFRIQPSVADGRVDGGLGGVRLSVWWPS